VLQGAEVNKELRSTTFLHRCLSVAVQRGNADCIFMKITSSGWLFLLTIFIYIFIIIIIIII